VNKKLFRYVASCLLLPVRRTLPYAFYFSLVACCLSLVPNLSASGLGTTGAQFLKIGMAARPLAMGGAFCAVADDVNSVYYNPAGLTRVEKSEVAATFLKYFEDVNAGFIGYASAVDSKSAIGAGITYLQVGNMERRDVNETLNGEFNSTDMALFMNYASKKIGADLLEDLSVGCGLKLISQEIDNEKAFTAAIDLAAFYPADKKLSFGLNIQNIGYGIKFVNDRDPLPLNVKFGAAYKPVVNLTVACDLDEYIIDNKFYASLGAEYWIKNMLALRAGYRYGYDTKALGNDLVGLGAGAGFRIWGVSVDYAFAPFGDLGDTHRISLGIKF